jgi:hypothetical protein
MTNKFYTLNKFTIEYPEDMDASTYDDSGCCGIIFHHDKFTYNIVHNKIDWDRLFINGDDGSVRDLPFHEGTWRFLPSCIKVSRN